MRPTNCFAVFALATLAFAIVPVPSANAAPPNDACALHTQAQMSAALGVSVGAGTHLPATELQTCTWNPSAAARKAVTSVTVSFEDAGAFSAGKALAQQMQAAVNQSKDDAKMADSASGIGDDAYYTTIGTTYTGLMVKKGKMALKVAIYGDMPENKKKAAEKTLALQALSKL